MISSAQTLPFPEPGTPGVSAVPVPGEPTGTALAPVIVKQCAMCPNNYPADVLVTVRDIGDCCWPCIELMREADA